MEKDEQEYNLHVALATPFTWGYQPVLFAGPFGGQHKVMNPESREDWEKRRQEALLNKTGV